MAEVLSGMYPRSDCVQVYLWVPDEKGYKFLSRITRCTNNSCFHLQTVMIEKYKKQTPRLECRGVVKKVFGIIIFISYKIDTICVPQDGRLSFFRFYGGLVGGAQLSLGGNVIPRPFFRGHAKDRGELHQIVQFHRLREH